jgi:hypothetical protein
VFKRSWHVLSDEQRQLTARLLPGKPWFCSYSNGKSAARVVSDTLPNGVHEFHAANPMWGRLQSSRPGILHRPYASAAQFCDKHMSQGAWDTSRVFGTPWTPPGVYAKAEDLVARNDVDGLRALYAQAVTVRAEELHGLEAAGLLLVPGIDLPLPIETIVDLPATLSQAATCLRSIAQRSEAGQPS